VQRIAADPRDRLLRFVETQLGHPADRRESVNSDTPAASEKVA
jgi:hypothetical protein